MFHVKHRKEIGGGINRRHIYIMTMTRNGIVYNLYKSPYLIGLNGITFYFSSKNHLEKFTEKMTENRELISYSLSKRFGITINVNMIADITLYATIETRGFLIEHKGDYYTCKKDIILSGAIQMKKR